MKSPQYQGYKSLKAAIKKAGFESIAKAYQPKAGPFRIKFGYTYTDWSIECRQDMHHHTLKIVDKSFFPEFFNDEDKEQYQAFKDWALNFRLCIAD